LLFSSVTDLKKVSVKIYILEIVAKISLLAEKKAEMEKIKIIEY